MKILVGLLVFFALIEVSDASVMFVQKDSFRCSDGITYDVARHYIGGWGPGSWNLVGFCSEGTLTRDNYNGRYLPVKDSHIDLKNCAEEESPEIISCYEEFKSLNGNQGGELEEIKHSVEADTLPRECYITGARYLVESYYGKTLKYTRLSYLCAKGEYPKIITCRGNFANDLKGCYSRKTSYTKMIEEARESEMERITPKSEAYKSGGSR